LTTAKNSKLWSKLRNNGGHRKRQNFELYLSEETLTELNHGNYPNKSEVLNSIAEAILLPANPCIIEIVDIYVNNYVMPKQVKGDAVHLAYASFHRLDFLLTWNCHHLANANKKRHIQIINSRLGLHTPEIVTPLQLFQKEII